MHRAAVEIKKEEEMTLPRPDAPGAPISGFRRLSGLRGPRDELPTIPPGISVARRLIDEWLHES